MARMTQLQLGAPLLLVAVTLAMSGCSEISEPDGTLGEVQAAVGAEPGCATTSIASPSGGSFVASASGASVSSPDDKYNTAGCPNQYVAEVTGFIAQCGSFFVDWDQPMPTNATDCASTRLQYHMYGYNGAWSGAVFNSYQAGLWNGASCTLGLNAPGYPNGSSNMTAYSKVRVAVEAWQWVDQRPDHKFVRVVCSEAIH